MHRLFRNILKNASIAQRYHFTIAGNIHVIFFFYIWIDVKDETKMHYATHLKEWTLTTGARLNFSKLVVPVPKIAWSVKTKQKFRLNDNFALMYRIYTNNFC